MPTISDEDKKDPALLMLYGKKVDIYLKRHQTYLDNQTKLYEVIFGQSMPTLEANIRSQKDFTDKDEAKDVIWLLNVVKKLSVGIDDNQNETITAIEALTNFYSLRQDDAESNDDYMARFKELWRTAEAAAGTNCLVPSINRTSEKYKNLSDEAWTEAMKAAFFFVRANRARFGAKIREVSAAVVLGVDNYPSTLDQAFRILTETQKAMLQASNRTTNNSNVTSGASNYQRLAIPDGEEVVLGTDRRVHNIRCNNCNAWGHYARECPRIDSTVSSMSKNKISRQCNVLKYLLDTGSTHNTVNNKNHLTNVFKSNVLHMTSSAGDVMEYNTKGLLQPFNVETYYTSS
jgi:hypothetical protein